MLHISRSRSSSSSCGMMDGSPASLAVGATLRRASAVLSTYNVNQVQTVAALASTTMPSPAAIPIEAVIHMLDAVVRPLTVELVRKIVPAPKKPMPVMIWAANLDGSTGPGPSP